MQAATHPVSYWAHCPPGPILTARLSPARGGFGAFRLIQSNAVSNCPGEEFADPGHAGSITWENGVTWICVHFDGEPARRVLAGPDPSMCVVPSVGGHPLFSAFLRRQMLGSSPGMTRGEGQ